MKRNEIDRSNGSGFEFGFIGGVKPNGNHGHCKFLMFFLNGPKEISFSEARSLRAVRKINASRFNNWVGDRWETDLPIVKIFMQETGSFGSPRFLQSFYLAMTNCQANIADRQTVTIKPLSEQTSGTGFIFRAAAKFLSKKEVSQILDPSSLSYKLFMKQTLPPVSVLKQVITIERKPAADVIKDYTHGGVRKLNIV